MPSVHQAVQALAVTSAALALLLLPASALAAGPVVFRGFGTATIDGTLGPAEWNSASHVDFTVNRSSSGGGGTVPATIYVMNDTSNLYFGVKVLNALVGASTLEFQFDGDRDGNTLEQGEDVLYVPSVGGLQDRFWQQVAPNAWQAFADTLYGGTADGAEWDADATGYSFYELSHPFNDLDDRHDISVGFAKRTSFSLRFQHCSPCAEASYFPSRNMEADVVVVSGTRVPPDTQLTVAPPEGLVTSRVDARFEFTGTDDVAAPPELTFECRLDESEWSVCATPYLVTGLSDGPHTIGVRAVDEMLNVDPTPEGRTWRVDRTGPSKPKVRGPRVARTPTPVYRFSARDASTPSSRIRFKCAFDSKRLHRCAPRYRQRLRPGRHTLRVAGVDRLGNVGAKTVVRISVKSPR